MNQCIVDLKKYTDSVIIYSEKVRVDFLTLLEIFSPSFFLHLNSKICQGKILQKIKNMKIKNLKAQERSKKAENSLNQVSSSKQHN